MSDLVPTKDIERIVGAKRHLTLHLARAVSAEQRVYILHSQECWFESVEAPVYAAIADAPSLKDCPYSLALDEGIDEADWMSFEDQPVIVTCEGTWGSQRLVPHAMPAVS